jgi:hypothetical protein
MKPRLSVVAMSVLLITGCSFEPEKEYDPMELQIWQSCIDAFVDENAGFYSSNEILMDRAVEACQKYTPKKY